MVFGFLSRLAYKSNFYVNLSYQSFLNTTQNISTWYEKICATTDYQNVEFSEDIRLNIEN